MIEQLAVGSLSTGGVEIQGRSPGVADKDASEVESLIKYGGERPAGAPWEGSLYLFRSSSGRVCVLRSEPFRAGARETVRARALLIDAADYQRLGGDPFRLEPWLRTVVQQAPTPRLPALQLAEVVAGEAARPTLQLGAPILASLIEGLVSEEDAYLVTATDATELFRAAWSYLPDEVRLRASFCTWRFKVPFRQARLCALPMPYRATIPQGGKVLDLAGGADGGTPLRAFIIERLGQGDGPREVRHLVDQYLRLGDAFIQYFASVKVFREGGCRFDQLPDLLKERWRMTPDEAESPWILDLLRESLTHGYPTAGALSGFVTATQKPDRLRQRIHGALEQETLSRPSVVPALTLLESYRAQGVIPESLDHPITEQVFKRVEAALASRDRGVLPPSALPPVAALVTGSKGGLPPDVVRIALDMAATFQEEEPEAARQIMDTGALLKEALARSLGSETQLVNVPAAARTLGALVRSHPREAADAARLVAQAAQRKGNALGPAEVCAMLALVDQEAGRDKRGLKELARAVALQPQLTAMLFERLGEQPIPELFLEMAASNVRGGPVGPASASVDRASSKVLNWTRILRQAGARIGEDMGGGGGAPNWVWALVPAALLLGVIGARVVSSLGGPDVRPNLNLATAAMAPDELESWAAQLQQHADRDEAAQRLREIRAYQVEKWLDAQRADALANKGNVWQVLGRLRHGLTDFPQVPGAAGQRLAELYATREHEAVEVWWQKTTQGGAQARTLQDICKQHDQVSAEVAKATREIKEVGLPEHLGEAIARRHQQFLREVRLRYTLVLDQALEAALKQPTTSPELVFQLLKDAAGAPLPREVDGSGLEVQLLGCATALWNHYQAHTPDLEVRRQGLAKWKQVTEELGGKLSGSFVQKLGEVTKSAEAALQKKPEATLPSPPPPEEKPQEGGDREAPIGARPDPGTSTSGDAGTSVVAGGGTQPRDDERGTPATTPAREPGTPAYLAPGLVVVPLNPSEWRFSFPAPPPPGMPGTFPSSRLTHFGSFASRNPDPSGATRVIGLYVADGPPALVLNELERDLQAAGAPFLLSSREQLVDGSLFVSIERELRPTITALRLFRQRGGSPAPMTMRLDCRAGLWSRALDLKPWSRFLTVDDRDLPEFRFMLEFELGDGGAAAGSAAVLELQACRDDDGVPDADLARHYTPVTDRLEVKFRRGERETIPFRQSLHLDDYRHLRVKVVSAECARKQEGAIRAIQVGYGNNIKTILLVSTALEEVPVIRRARRLSDADDLTLEALILEVSQPLENHWDRLRLSTQAGSSREDVATAVQRTSGKKANWTNPPELRAFTPTAQPARLAVLGRAGLNWARLVSVALESVPRQPIVADDLVLDLDAEVHDPRLSNPKLRLLLRVGARDPQ